jgi:DNA/RNA endonuclease G (NUC1)
MDLSINQRSTQERAGWWAWEIWLDGPDALLDQVDAVVYTLHPTFPNPRQRVTDRRSRFLLRSGGWGEFMIYAEVNMSDGRTVPLRHYLRLQEVATGSGRTLFLTSAKEDENLADDLQDRLEKGGFEILRVPDSASIAKTTAAIVVLSSNQSSWFESDLQMIREAHTPLLFITLQTFEVPPCLAAYRCPPNPDTRAAAAVAWLVQLLDRPQLPWDQESLSPATSAFWNRRLALAAMDLQRATQCVFPLIVDNAFHAAALAVARNLLIAPAEGLLQRGLIVRLRSGDCPVELIGPAKELAVLRLPNELPTYLSPAEASPTSPLVAALGLDAGLRVTLSPGWLTSAAQSNPLTHDAASTTPGAAVVSLENGSLLGIDLRPGRTLPVTLIRDLLPPTIISVSAASVAGAGLESAQEDFFERAKSKPEDYANRKGYDSNFLGTTVPLPQTRKRTELLRYTNFSVALSDERRLTLYAVVNINGRRLVEKHRAGDPWQLDPRVSKDLQVGGDYYQGTPLDRGHMVRRVDPVWGKDAEQAELDTFHYPNSCPQHKNLNRKTWNDLEDYIYINLQREDLKVTVFTGPVLADDDAVFHGLKLPKEFWKVVVMQRDDGRLSATAYLLSQEDMIEGLEFVYGEFRTYQVPVELIEKKTGLDFGSLRDVDPAGKRTAFESLEGALTEIRGPEDLKLDEVTNAPAAVKGPAVAQGVWSEPAEGERQLNLALDTFDWNTADQLLSDLTTRLVRSPGNFDELFARRILSRLQRKRRFVQVTRAGDAFLQAGFVGGQIRRRYAQALIDQGIFHAAERVLRAMIADTSVPPFEQEEAQGLLGRIGKQIYVNADAPENPRNVAQLQNAVDSYWLNYALDPAENYWHGINVVACLRRAEADGVKLQSPAAPLELAGNVLQNLENREKQSKTGELSPSELATFVEVHLALGQSEEAIKRARMYAECNDADAFEIAATLRQLEEVWRLRDHQPPGDTVLPILRAALLKRAGGSLQLSVAGVRSNLEKVFGADRSVSLKWYTDGLERAKSIARIETNGKGFGTGWLANSADFFPGRSGLLLVTNAHVIGPATPDRYHDSLRPEDATVHFQIQGWKLPPGKVQFHSPVNELDATFLELPNLPADAQALPLDPQLLEVASPPQRLYIIGHPGGRELEFSLQDNYLLAANERLVHYRTPSEGGSSGSPVFGPTDWKVVALHHAGRKDMPRLDGQPGTYEANEGIALPALVKGTSSDTPVRLAHPG